MESALKIALVLVTAPLWIKPLRQVLDEIVRVARLPDQALEAVRPVGTREKMADRSFQEISPQTRQAWVKDQGRVSNPRWETGRRPLPPRAHQPLGEGFASSSRRSGLRANQSRFGSGDWRGGFGRR